MSHFGVCVLKRCATITSNFNSISVKLMEFKLFLSLLKTAVDQLQTLSVADVYRKVTNSPGEIFR